MEPGSPQRCIAGGQETKDINGNREFLMDVRKNFFPKDSQAAEQVAERGCAVSTLGDFQDNLV